ncbi:endonuclease/exonuclease/phosphatase family protein [Alloyangia pacifica]|uniref:Endonuclease/Exonuclease/phosphatase family protein n=1 Tax=Alloyangia pacifica TaxID=311180 RepID=A0A1I6UL99_9RHOB|nr:endonuclease/exonuclease/phosphatase family protein [Alloyangia pacifica]SDH74065.1 Endonuclease/Exonuclease/phosphatase family protein [Alloyangia pacifica]SFT02193.1 Endonuclease/Exonuclease/phosphatase family protein [Alloyangia pacifica]
MASSRNSRNITFATFNLYNLQLPGEPFRKATYTQAEYDAKIAWSARMLLELDADVIAFQELWHPQALHDLFERVAGLTGPSGKVFNYDLHFIKEPGITWYDIAVAVAVRKPWTAASKSLHKQFGPGFLLKKRGGKRDPEDNEIEVEIEKFSRTVIALDIVNADKPKVPAITVFASHLKSKLPTRLDAEEWAVPAIRNNATALGAALSTIRRTAEAAALRDILGDALRDNDRPVVLLGDLNDGASSNTLAIITEQPSFKLFEASASGARSDRGLYAASRLQSYRLIGAGEHTHEYNGEREVLDHVLVSEQFYDHSDNRKWSFQQMRIWNDHLEDGNPASSDHGVVRAVFWWDPRPEDKPT